MICNALLRWLFFFTFPRQLELHRLPRELRIEIRLYLETPSKGAYYWHHPAETRALDLLCLCPARKFRKSGQLVQRRPAPVAETDICSKCGVRQNVSAYNNSVDFPYRDIKSEQPLPTYIFRCGKTASYNVWDKPYFEWPQTVVISELRPART